MVSPTNSLSIAAVANVESSKQELSPVFPATTSLSAAHSCSFLDPHLTNHSSGKIGLALVTTNSIKYPRWIIDSSVTNHMTFDQSLLQTTRTQHHSSVANANGVSYPVGCD